MSEPSLRYDRMVEAALRGVVRAALEHAAAHGLPGDHHFYITFRTQAPGVEMPPFLRARYPKEITIVLQHQFWDLKVGDDSFSVGLSFDNQIAQLTVPFAALSAFVDPSVKFGLQFEATSEEAAQPTPKAGGSVPAVHTTGDLVPVDDAAAPEPATEAAEQKPSAEVVSLETFRKK